MISVTLGSVSCLSFKVLTVLDFFLTIHIIQTFSSCAFEATQLLLLSLICFLGSGSLGIETASLLPGLAWLSMSCPSRPLTTEDKLLVYITGASTGDLPGNLHPFVTSSLMAIHTTLSLCHSHDLTHNGGTPGGRWAAVSDCHPPHAMVFKNFISHSDPNLSGFQLGALKFERPEK